MKPRKLLFPLFLLILLGFIFQFFVMLHWWRAPSVNAYEPVYIEIKTGSSLKSIANQLYRAGLIDHPHYFILLTRLQRQGHNIKAGEYLFPPGATPKEIYLQLNKGRVMQRAITLVEGWTFKQFMASLAKQPLLKHDLSSLSAQQIMLTLNLKQTSPEGLFFPDTYFYLKGAPESTILKTAYKNMEEHLNKAWQSRATNLPYQTPYDALIAASIVEKESAAPFERPLISSVLINRLKQGIPLQMDPTVIYGLGDTFNGDITAADLKQDTPYNTYLHSGLPPTPIAMPSAGAINASLHPANTSYLYFVANGTGTHQFSNSLAEHDKAVKAYLKQLNQRSNTL